MRLFDYIFYNKRRSIFTILGVSLASLLLISIGIFFSSLRGFLIDSVSSSVGDYHVIINSTSFSDKSILKKKYKDNRYFVKYKNIYSVYKNTEMICNKVTCESVTYNDSLLSLYGISKNKNLLSTFKKIIWFLILFFGFLMFFIIYNTFKANLKGRIIDIYLFKLIGAGNIFLYKLFFLESFLLGIIGVFIGFLLSIILNLFINFCLNNYLYELFKGNLKISIYLPFIIIPVFCMIVILILSSFLPLFNIKKYNAMDLFRHNSLTNVNYSFKINNFSLWLGVINFKRNFSKYKSLIVCLFIVSISINVCFLFLRYSLKCIKDYVIIPDYDVVVETDGDVSLEKIALDLDYKKKKVYRFCSSKTFISKENFNKYYSTSLDSVITDDGGNYVINEVDRVLNDGGLKRVHYKRFNSLDKILFDDVVIDKLSLKNEIPFGYFGDSLYISLGDRFDEVCPSYKKRLVLKTDYKGISKYLDNLIKKGNSFSYLNIKKSKEITNNLITVLKIFLYGICILIILVMNSVVFNIVFSSFEGRGREFSLLYLVGTDNKKILVSFLFESFIVCFFGVLYSFPFIFIINKYMFAGIRSVLYLKSIILNLDIILLCFVCFWLITFLYMLVYYNRFYKKDRLNSLFTY